MHSIETYVGPPGTGKTYRLLEEVEELCNIYMPSQICAVSHTVAAVKEIQNRIMEKLNVSKEKIKNCRTIHSHAFSLLGLKSEQVFETAKNMRLWNETHGHRYPMKGGQTDQMPMSRSFMKTGDDLLAETNVLRSRMVDLGQWPSDCERFFELFQEFLLDNDVMDFTTMLTEVLRRELTPKDIKVLIADESQDLSPLAWAVVRFWGSQCDKEMFFADPNQALFVYSGASPETFMDMEHTKRVELTQSYRLSPAVLKASVKILNRCSRSEKVALKPTMEYGQGKVYRALEPDLTLPGTHAILTRCNFQLAKWIEMLRDKNVPYHNPYRPEEARWNPLTTDAALSIREYLTMLKSHKMNGIQIQQMAKNMIAKGNMKRGTKKKLEKLPQTTKHWYELWEIASMGFNVDFLERQGDLKDYFRCKTDASDMIFDAAEQGLLDEEPSVTVGTVHSVKGATFDNVWLDLELTKTISKNIYKTEIMDAEVRIAYVGVTRARSVVGFLPAKRWRNPII